MAKSKLFSKKLIVYYEWTILANNADEKSKQKIWIFSSNDYFNKSITHSIKLFSIITGITVSFILHFYSIAIQNLYVTDPFSVSFKIFIVFFTTIIF